MPPPAPERLTGQVPSRRSRPCSTSTASTGQAAAAGTLPTIAPRRFNPEGQVVAAGAAHPARPTGRSRRCIRIPRVRTNSTDQHDWVVLYAEDEAHHERQYTAVTEVRGTLAGRRVVRGREDECRALVEGR